MLPSGLLGRSLVFGVVCSLLTCAARAVPEERAVRRPANRLALETSPYLKLHAGNPVDWYPWGPEALEKSKKENKPIFLSIGYSSCFWCHVMERDVFENEDIAKYMNEHFVNIKVDREERPDLDDLYMLALQIYLQAAGSKQGGGWPMSLFLTPDGKPIAGGTYFPAEDMPGRQGFGTVLRKVDALWVQQEAKVRETADVLAREVKRLSVPQNAAAEIPTGAEQDAVKQLTGSFDSKFGGFEFRSSSPDAPKFPQPSKLMFLEWAIERGIAPEAAEKLDFTLTNMAQGGLYDHLGGGFHRYSTDREWAVPHFEKMLYDNAQLAEVYAAAAKRTGRADFRTVAEETLAFLQRDMADMNGGFYSALDAETNGVEGAYYVWASNDVKTILGASADLFMSAYGLDQPSNFEHGHVLHRGTSDADLAKAFKISEADVAKQLAAAKQQLLAVRQTRPALLRDDKILAGWNGLTIRALAHCGQWLDRPDYTEAAEKAAGFVLSKMRTPEGVLSRSFCEGRATQDACLDDFSFLADGLLALHAASGKDEWLKPARQLMDQQLAAFSDADAGGFFSTGKDHEQLMARMKDSYDGVLPSGNGVSARVLLELANRTGEESYRDAAKKALSAFAKPISDSPAGHVQMIQAIAELPTASAGEVVAFDADLLVAAAPKAKGAEAGASKEKLIPVAEASEAEAKKHDHLVAKAFLNVDSVESGGKARIAIVFQAKEGWHVYANPAGNDFSVPTEVEIESTGNVETSDIKYPAGKKHVSGTDSMLILEGKQVIFTTLTWPANAKPGSDELTVNLSYQACNDDTCLLRKTIKLTGKVPVAKKGQAAKSINKSLFALDK